MASSSARSMARRQPYNRSNTAVSSATDSSVSTPYNSNSPFDSPNRSPSTTSLSSVSSQEDLEFKKKNKDNVKLVDTYGNDFAIPDFTIKQIRDAIPAHCFDRSAVTGLLYVARDLLYLAVVFVAFNTFATEAYVPNWYVRFALWTVYTVIQGIVGTGVWVLAHECGHQSFSASKVLNDSVGWVLHSALLVPYFSWKISHGKHHKATGNLARDMVHVPKTKEVYATNFKKALHEIHELTEETPIATALGLLLQQLFGWPVYLLTNATGHNNHADQKEGRGKGKKNGWLGGVDHFSPSSPLYEAKDAKLILLSDLGLAIMGLVLYAASQRFGALNVFVWYGVPYLWVNHWLVAVTFLQHTDPSLPHYSAGSWTFPRGAAATIDREFGVIGRHFMHGIIETHVLHHFVSTIPFYHADEATEAIKPVMGQHYRSDVSGGSLGFLSALYRVARWCQWIETTKGVDGESVESGVWFYRNRNGLGVAPVL